MEPIRLKALRKMNHMTQEELAALLNVSQQTISRYENGVHYPDIDSLIQLADFFNVPVDVLIGRRWPLPKKEDTLLEKILEPDQAVSPEEAEEIRRETLLIRSAYEAQEELAANYLNIGMLSPAGQKQIRDIYNLILQAEGLDNL
ncbi:MAG: helix-turn-helix domain-containing protein [Anaerovoracaceae bacterium]